MPSFNVKKFVTEVREAANNPGASRDIRQIMSKTMEELDAVNDAFSSYGNADKVLFEDDGISIWYCAFDPTVHVPPHDHQTTATIGVIGGIEHNHFYQKTSTKLQYKSTKSLSAGDVIAIGPDGIHSVETEGNQHSYAIHIYQAPLTTIKRSLFEWETGAACPFNDDNYALMVRSSTT
ncbi:MAG: putative metal-dependent enzyme (double-stranded beta helix superfamily) [Gammaproteobacteria bacterium]|jgi:predicted metal-dependent enzyme (double-stranded beta helix superfamily)